MSRCIFCDNENAKFEQYKGNGYFLFSIEIYKEGRILNAVNSGNQLLESIVKHVSHNNEAFICKSCKTILICMSKADNEQYKIYKKLASFNKMYEVANHISTDIQDERIIKFIEHGDGDFELIRNCSFRVKANYTADYLDLKLTEFMLRKLKNTKHKGENNA